MISSRKITDLHPIVAAMAADFMQRCDAAGIDVLITNTYRDGESQDALYAQGRTKPGRIVTRARAGQSMHNYRLAFDVVPLRYGKPVWGTSGNGIDDNPADDDKDDLELWQRVGAIGKACGLEWSGDWVSFKEFPHFQYTSGLTLSQLQAGKTLPSPV